MCVQSYYKQTANVRDVTNKLHQINYKRDDKRPNILNLKINGGLKKWTFHCCYLLILNHCSMKIIIKVKVYASKMNTPCLKTF